MGLFSGLFGSDKAGKQAARLGTAAFDDWQLQRYLPPALRHEYSVLGEGAYRHPGGDIWGGLNAGLANIGELMANPGQLSSGVSSAIAPRLSMESEDIANNFRGIRANQAGMAARTNAPLSIKNALGSALDVAQFRAQRDARREAMTDSEALRRGDLENTYKVLALILDYINAGRGIGSQNLAALSQNQAAKNAALIGAAGTALSGGLAG